jgi:hypothetical protein
MSHQLKTKKPSRFEKFCKQRKALGVFIAIFVAIYTSNFASACTNLEEPEKSTHFKQATFIFNFNIKPLVLNQIHIRLGGLIWKL